MKKMKRNCLFFIAVTAAVLFHQPGATETVHEEDLKAEFIFRFLQYTDWPTPPATEFRLCLLGESNVADALERYAGRKIQGVPFTTTRLPAADLSGPCYAVFISASKRNELRQYIRQYGSEPVLLISDTPGAFEENIDIALVTEPNRISFCINRTTAGSKQFAFSGQMLKLASQVR